MIKGEKKMKKFCIAILAFVMVFSFAACKSSDDKAADGDVEGQIEEMEDEESEELAEMPEGEDTVYPEEVDGAVIEKVKTDPSKYVGTWEGKSYHAVELYGNIEVTVNSNGTWTANITEDNLKGKWTDKGDHLHMESDVFTFDLAFDKEGSMVLIEGEGDDALYTVLEKK